MCMQFPSFDTLASPVHEAPLALIFCFNCLYVWIPSYQACGFISNSYWLSAFLLTQRADRFITQIISDLPKSGVNTRAIGCSKLIMSFSATAEPADVLVYSTPAFNILLPILYRQSLPICRCERYSESQPIHSQIWLLFNPCQLQVKLTSTLGWLSGAWRTLALKFQCADFCVNRYKVQIGFIYI